MSPDNLFERPGPISQEVFADLTLCNSPETKEALEGLSPSMRKAEIWPNPAPAGFERSNPPKPSSKIEKLLCVSNHLPDTLARTLELLKTQGVEVTRIGRPEHPERLTPEILTSHDAVMTIGKTVQYALRARVPVFCYDRYNGPGWLSDENFEQAAHYNFSGRSHPSARTPDALAQEVIDGFSKAAGFAQALTEDRLAPYRLEDHIARLETMVASAEPRARKLTQKRRAELRAEMLRERDMFRLIDQEYAVARRKDRRIVGINSVTRPDPKRPITITRLHRRDTKRPLVAATFSFRYDAHLVPAMLENIAPAVDAWIAWDDREADAAFSGDAERQISLFEAARSIGADWILAVDPDERYEDALGEKMQDIIRQDPACWTFQCREMYTPTAYRTDGLWGNKVRLRLFPCLPGMEPDDEDLHGHWTRNSLNLPVRDTGLNFYHLRMATPERRAFRRDTYAIADPGRDRQGVGYDYLSDDRGCVLVEVPDAKRFSPAHVDDGGLWAAPLKPSGCTMPDPVQSRVRWLTHTMSHGGEASAFFAAKDLFDRAPEDPDFGYIAASLALNAGLTQDAREVLGRIKHTPTMAQCHARMMDRASHISGEPKHEDFAKPQATWRRWVKDARLHEGDKIAQSDMAAIVLGLRAPAQLSAAVASLRAQSEPLEIVVVNSDGGPAKEVLREHLDHIRLIEVSERLLPGGARNVGVDASSATFVSFLASDCTAAPGWAKGRLDRHHDGAQAVASAVVAASPNNLASAVSHAQLHWPRWPQTSSDKAALYGVSYARGLFAQCGYFPTGCLIGEDTELNRKVQNVAGIAWAPDVQVAHRYPTTLQALWKDMARRGYNRAFLPPFSTREDGPDFQAFIDSWIRGKTEKAHIAILEHLQPSAARLQRLLFTLRLAARAERVGVAKGAQEVFRAQALLQEADALPPDRADEAEALLRQAVSQLHMNAACHAALAQHLARIDPERHIDEVVAGAYTLVALDPHHNLDILPLCHAVQRAGRVGDTHSILRQATLAAPQRAGFWWHRSQVAHVTGDLSDQYDCLHVQLARTPNDPKLYEALAGFHAREKNPELSARREELARAL